MAFSTGILTGMQVTGAGELYGVNTNALSATTFEDGLYMGRFAKLASGQIDNMDGSAAPVIAGIVLRPVTQTYEDGVTIDTNLHEVIEYVRDGYVTVSVKTGESPVAFGKVYASNAGDANDGLATADESDVATNAEFIEEIATGTWLVRIGAFASSPVLIADPGDGEAIPALVSGNCALTTVGAETRTLADPAVVGLTLAISLDVDGGDAVITTASAVNQTGNNTLTMADAGDIIVLTSVQVAGVPEWRITANDGVALTTV